MNAHIGRYEGMLCLAMCMISAFEQCNTIENRRPDEQLTGQLMDAVDTEESTRQVTFCAQNCTPINLCNLRCTSATQQTDQIRTAKQQQHLTFVFQTKHVKN